MTRKLSKPRFFVLGGALEYQRVTNHLSSFDTLLQQVSNCLPLSFSLGLYIEVLFCRFLVLQLLCPVDVLAITNYEVMTFGILLFFMGSLRVYPGT